MGKQKMTVAEELALLRKALEVIFRGSNHTGRYLKDGEETSSDDLEGEWEEFNLDEQNGWIESIADHAEKALTQCGAPVPQFAVESVHGARVASDEEVASLTGRSLADAEKVELLKKTLLDIHRGSSATGVYRDAQGEEAPAGHPGVELEEFGLEEQTEWLDSVSEMAREALLRSGFEVSVLDEDEQDDADADSQVEAAATRPYGWRWHARADRYAQCAYISGHRNARSPANPAMTRLENALHQVAKFRNYENARRFADRAIPVTDVLLGDDELFWVPTSSGDFGRLLKAGYELAR